MDVNADTAINCIVSSVVRESLCSIMCSTWGEKQLTSIRLLRKVENMYVIFYDIRIYLVTVF